MASAADLKFLHHPRQTLALGLHYWMIAGVLGPVVVVLTLRLWVEAERDVRGRS